MIIETKGGERIHDVCYINIGNKSLEIFRVNKKPMDIPIKKIISIEDDDTFGLMEAKE